jgi:hypothetical protein
VQANRNTEQLFGPIGKCFPLVNTLAHTAAHGHTLAMYASLGICDRLSHAPYFCPKIQAQYSVYIQYSTSSTFLL